MAKKPEEFEDTSELEDFYVRTAEFPAGFMTALAATPEGADLDAWFDVKVIYQQDHTSVDTAHVPAVFKPPVGPFQLTDYEKIYATDPMADIFETAQS